MKTTSLSEQDFDTKVSNTDDTCTRNFVPKTMEIAVFGQTLGR
jgi:hypothetical protein